MELSQLISSLKNDEFTEPHGVAESKYHELPSNKFSLKQQNNVVEWEIDKSYFSRNHLVLIDILAANKWERPVYFMATMGKEAYFGLTDYLQLEGFAYQLVSTKKAERNKQVGTTNATVMYDNLMHKFDWSGIKSISPHDKHFYIHSVLAFCKLADALGKENKHKQAKAVLDKCIELMPNEIICNDYSTIHIINSYYKIHEFEKGNDIAKK